MKDLEHLILLDLLTKMKAECENSGVCCECDCVTLCPFAFSGSGGGPDGEPWAYLDTIEKEVVRRTALNAAEDLRPCN